MVSWSGMATLITGPMTEDSSTNSGASTYSGSIPYLVTNYINNNITSGAVIHSITMTATNHNQAAVLIVHE